MQDGAKPHTTDVGLDFLHQTFNEIVISNWFPSRCERGTERSQIALNVNPCDYFLQGFLKENISPKYPQTLLELRELIIDACNKITEGMSRHRQPGSSCWRSC